MADIDKIKQNLQELAHQLTKGELTFNQEKQEMLLRKKDVLEKIIEKQEELKENKEKLEENKAILKSEKDPELLTLAEGESHQLKEREKQLEEDIKELLTESENLSETPKEKSQRSVIVEIRAGTGGEEAALFAANLYRMYSKYAQSQTWKMKVLDSRPTELGGFKEITFELSPIAKQKTNVFSKMQYEGGVHRVQRIPKTEKGGRIHTSTASVAVLLKPKKAQITVKPEDLKIDLYRASGPGGQYVNKRETAVRITHLPSNIVVTSQTERNQLQNKENAMKILEAKLLEKKEKEEIEKLSGTRRSQIKKAQRADKIRTYNFPQDRITDHRIKKSFRNIEKIMAGNLEPMLKSLTRLL